MITPIMVVIHAEKGGISPTCKQITFLTSVFDTMNTCNHKHMYKHPHPQCLSGRGLSTDAVSCQSYSTYSQNRSSSKGAALSQFIDAVAGKTFTMGSQPGPSQPVWSNMDGWYISPLVETDWGSLCNRRDRLMTKSG